MGFGRYGTCGSCKGISTDKFRRPLIKNPDVIIAEEILDHWCNDMKKEAKKLLDEWDLDPIRKMKFVENLKDLDE